MRTIVKYLVTVVLCASARFAPAQEPAAIDSMVRMKQRYSELYMSYAKQGDLAHALICQKRFSEITDSVFSAGAGRQIQEMETRYQSEKKQKQIELLDKANQLQSEQLDREKTLTLWVIIGALVFLLSGGVVFSRFRLTQRQKKIIEAQKLEVDEAYGKLHEKNQEVMDSIFYARRIQRALITSEKYISRNLSRLSDNG